MRILGNSKSLAFLLAWGFTSTFCSSTRAQNVLIDFDDLPSYTVVTNQYSSLGVSFDGNQLFVLTLGSSLNPIYPPASGNNVVDVGPLAQYPDTFGIIQANFDPRVAGDVHSVAARITASTPIYMLAYDQSGNLIAEANTPGDNRLRFGNGRPNYLLTVSSLTTPIAKVIMHDHGNYFLMDNFAYSSEGALPRQPDPVPVQFPNSFFNIRDGGYTIIAPYGPTLVDNGAPQQSSAPYCFQCGQPVNLATGAMWHSLIDFNVKGRTEATNLLFKRTYLSHSLASDGDFGGKWVHNWETRLVSISDNVDTNLLWIDEVGGGWTFIRNPDGSFTSPPAFLGHLSEYPDHYELVKKHGVKLTFSKSPALVPLGRLLSLSEPHGETVTLSYGTDGALAKIESPFAGSVQIQRDRQGRILNLIRTRESYNYAFSYDQAGNLISSADVDGNLTHYTYVDKALPSGNQTVLSSIRDVLGHSILFNYDQQLRMSSQSDVDGSVRSFTYSMDSLGNRITVMKEIDNNTTTYTFDSHFRLIRALNPDQSIEKLSWNDRNLLTSRTDGLGNTTTYFYDTRGNLIGIQKPLDPKPVLIAYDTVFDLPVSIRPIASAPTELVRDHLTGDLEKVSRTSSSEVLAETFTNDIFGNPVKHTNPNSSYEDVRDQNGLLITRFDARNPESRIYDSQGRTTERSFKNGRIIRYTYDHFDRVTKVDDSSGPTTVLSYDLLGRIITRTVLGTTGGTQVSSYEYDESGRLIASVNALGKRTEFNYSLGARLASHPSAVIDPDSKVTKTTYDVMHRVSAVTDRASRVTSYGYDLAGRLISVSDALGATTRFEYDANGRTLRRIRLSMITDSLSGKSVASQEITTYTYDLDGKVTKEERLVANSTQKVVTELNYDAFGRMARKVMKRVGGLKVLQIQDDSRFSYLPILETNLLAAASNGVEKLEFTYETVPPFKALTSKVISADPKNSLQLITGDYSLSWDPSGYLAKISDLSGKPLFEKAYDPAGRLTEVLSEGFRGVDHDDDQNDQRKKRIGGAFKIALQYDTFGRLSGEKDSNGLELTNIYDVLNRIENIKWESPTSIPFMKDALVTESVVYDDIGNITASKRENFTSNYTYDDASELVGVRSEKSSSLGLIGNLLNQQPLPKELNQTASYDLVGNRVLSSIQGSADFISNSIISDANNVYQADQDGFGNQAVKINRQTGEVQKFTYRADGKLVQFEKSRPLKNNRKNEKDSDDSFPKVLYFYDALGRRVTKVITGGRSEGNSSFTQNYSYLNGEDRILLAKSGMGETTLYVDGNGIDQHLAEINSRGKKTYINEHLGSILNTVAAGQNRGFGPYGENLDGNILQIKENSNPVIYGFAGRQLDPESGGYYYRARTYNPDTGRFLTKDPVGFRGGINLYGYVFNDPVNLRDPTGLAPGDIYPSESSAGNAAIGDINPVSIGIGTEFGGTVYSSGGGYTYTDPVMLGGAGGSLGIPPGSTAIYHTHGSNDPGYDNNNYSPVDLQTSYSTGMNMYLGTPNGGPVQFFSPVSGGINQCHK